jgi:hypothetical protein
MKKQKAYLLVLLAVATTAVVQAQTTDSFTFTTARVVSDGSSFRSTDVHSAGSVNRKLFTCAKNQNNNTKNN